MKEITLTINGQQVNGKAGDSIIDVAQAHGIPIPTLCHDPCLIPVGACRVCLVEDEKRGTLTASCVTPIASGMAIRTDSEKVLEARKVVVKLMIASHPESCILCEKGNRCTLRQIAADLGVGIVEYYDMPSFTGSQELNPFIRRDLSKCILCAKCIRADHELVVEGAIDYMDRGFDARPATLTDGPLEISECTFCGTCVEMCPTGALFERDKPLRGTATNRVPTTCSFCGCGCSLWLGVAHNNVVGVQPAVSDPKRPAALCAKGHYGYDYINHPDRLRTPLIRKDGELAEVSWDEALQAAGQALDSIKKKKGKGSLALLTGPHCTNEEAYVMRHFASHALNTDHVLCNTGMDISNLTEGMEETLGFVGANTSLENLETAETILLIGANPTETAPVAGYGIKRGIRNRQAKLIIIDPLEIKLTKHAALWLQPFINTDEFVLTGFLKLLLENDRFKKALPDQYTKEVKEIEKRLNNFPLDKLQTTTGVSPDTLRQAAETFCTAEKRAVVFGNGIIQQPRGKHLVKIISTIAQLANKQTTLIPLLKQSNTLGCLHMGLTNRETPEELTAKIMQGTIKGLWIIGDDPLESMTGGKEFEKALDKLEVLIVSDHFLNSTAGRAHIVLPSATFAEKAGTLTSLDGRVQPVRPAIGCVGQSRPDWLIILQIAEQLGAPLKFTSAQEITEEINKRVPLYAGITSVLDSAEYICHYLPLPSSRKKTSVYIPDGNPEMPPPDKKYPYKAMTGSILFQLGRGYQTKHSRKLDGIVDEAYVEINPADARQLGIQQKDAIKLISASGEATTKVCITDRVPSGVLFLPLPFTTGSTLLPMTDPGLGRKTCQVKIERITP